jgi:hypothetical protein
MELKHCAVRVHRYNNFIEQKYKFYHSIYWITIHNTQFVCHAIIRSAAVTILLLLVGGGVKRRADRRGSIVRVTASVLCEFRKVPLRRNRRVWSCRKHTPVRTTLYQWSARRPSLYLQNTKRNTSMPSAGFEPAISEIK